MMKHLLSRLLTPKVVLFFLPLLLAILVTYPAYALDRQNEISKEVASSSSISELPVIHIEYDSLDDIATFALIDISMNEDPNDAITGLAEAVIDEDEANGYKVLQYAPVDKNGRVSFKPITNSFRSVIQDILPNSELGFGIDRVKFYYDFYWYWDLDFILLASYGTEDDVVWGRGDLGIATNDTDEGRAYPNFISFNVDRLKKIHPGLTNYGFIDSEGNKTTDGVIELIPNYYFSNETTSFQMYIEIDGKEYNSDLSLKVPGVHPPRCVASAQTVKINHDNLFGTLHDLDDKFGHREYEDMKLVLENGKTLRPHQTGEYEYVFHDLPPKSKYEVTFIPYYVRHSTGERMRIDGGVRPVLTGETESPYWYSGGGTLVVSKTKSRVYCSTNMERTNDSYVEWREVGKTEESDINTTPCPIIDRQLKGILSGLDPAIHYEWRAVYEMDGERYVGDWNPLFTGEAEGWYEPEVAAQSTWIEEDGSVTLRGSVLPGSGEVTEQGFEIWQTEQTEPSTLHVIRRAEGSHRVIPCDGINMMVNLSDLTPGTYTYRTYAKVGSKTITGNETTIIVPGGVSGVDGIAVDEDAVEIIGYYNLQGVRSDKPFGGMNIVVYFNGKTEKRIFKNL